MYSDDGLRLRLAPLLATSAELTADLAHMGRLLDAAKSEVYVFSKPRTFPTEQYRILLDSCHVVLGVFLALLHSLQSGETSLECCQRHIGDLSEAGVRLSAAFTALSYLIRPPKKAKSGKKKKKRGVQTEHSGGGGGGGGWAAGAAGLARLSHWRSALGLHPAGPSSATAEAAVAAAQAAIAAHDAAAVQAEQGAAQQLGRQQQQQLAEPAPELAAKPDVTLLCEEDDPFAALGDAGPEPGAAKRVAMSDSQLLSAQQMARHLSRVMTLSQRPGLAQPPAGAPPSPPLEELREESAPLPSPPPVAAGAAANGGESPGRRSPGGDGGAAGAAGGTLGSVGSVGYAASAAERRDWVQAKMVALVDSIKQLERDAYQERLQDPNAAGLPTFVVVVHSLISTMRQCGTCLTALDPEHGARLHAYYKAARKTGRLEEPVMAL